MGLAKGARMMPMVAPANMQIQIAATVPRRVTGHSSVSIIPALGSAMVNMGSQKAAANVTSHVSPKARPPDAITSPVVETSEKAVAPIIAAASGERMMAKAA